MKRYKVKFSYKGSNYHGWQIQPNAKTVQGEINEVLKKILNLSEVDTVGSGRTDAGVHATTQYLHLDLSKEIPENICYKLNSVLPKDIKIEDFAPCKDDFHARFDAVDRAYQYRIYNEKQPFQIDQYYLFRPELDLNKMNEAAKFLLGNQDFEAFSKTHTEVFTFNCDIKEAYWQIENDGAIVFYIKANRFLRGMVRAIVGTLLEIGNGKMDPLRIKEIIESKNRSNAGRSVPAEGLFLCEVNY